VLLDGRLRDALSMDLLTPLYYIQYRHRNCPFAGDHPELIHQKEQLIRKIMLRKRIPVHVTNYMLQWL